MQECDWPTFLYGCIGGRTYRRSRRQLRMVRQSDSLPVVKQAAELPRSDFHSVAKPATESLQSVPQTDPPPVVKPAGEHVEAASSPTVTRSCRLVKPPARFQDFAT